MRLMTVLSSRGRLVPVGGWPIAVADLLCWGCDLLELPCWRGLSLPLRRLWAALAAALAVSSRILSVVVEGPAAAARWDEVRGGAIGAVAADVAVVFMAGEFWVDGGSGCARGVVRLELWEAAGEWWAWGVVGVLGEAPLLGRREGRRAEAGDAATGDDCC